MYVQGKISILHIPTHTIKSNVEKIKDIISHGWKRIQPIMRNEDTLADASNHKRLI